MEKFDLKEFEQKMRESPAGSDIMLLADLVGNKLAFREGGRPYSGFIMGATAQLGSKQGDFVLSLWISINEGGRFVTLHKYMTRADLFYGGEGSRPVNNVLLFEQR